MRHNHFSMLPELAFQPRRFGGMTLEGGGGGAAAAPAPSRPSNPQPVSPYTSAGGGFLGRGSTAAPVAEQQFSSNYYLQQNPDVAADPYYSSNPFHHYQDYGAVERRSPYQGFQYAPSQQPLFNQRYAGLGGRPDMVMDAYQRIVGRNTPDQEGFNYWTGQMNRGLTGQGLVSGFTGSPEFQRQQEYQRAYTEAFRPGYQEFGPSGQYYQPIYQSRYTNYSNAPGFYSPSYGAGMPSFPSGGRFRSDPYTTTMASDMRGNRGAAVSIGDVLGSMRGLAAGRFKEGGEIESDEDEGITALTKK